VSQKRGLAVFFGCVIAVAVAYAATYSRFHPQPATIAATTSAPALASAAIALTADLAPLPVVGGPLSWARLTPAQRAALAPFAAQWDSFSDARKRNWLKIAARFQKLPPDEQKRLQERWTEWVKMTPEQRRVARENYQVSKDLSAQARERAWKAYQLLPEEQKARLAATERRRRTVVSAPPTGKPDRDVSRLVNAHEQPASAALTVPPAAASGPGAQAAPAAASTPPPAPAQQPLPGTSSMFTGS
jgi:hypothetical protein